MNFIEVSVLTADDCIAQTIYRSSRCVTRSFMKNACSRMIRKFESAGTTVVSAYAKIVPDPVVGPVPEELFSFKGSVTLELVGEGIYESYGL